MAKSNVAGHVLGSFTDKASAEKAANALNAVMLLSVYGVSTHHNLGVDNEAVVTEGRRYDANGSYMGKGYVVSIRDIRR